MFASLWESLLPIGRDPRTGGYRRFSWTAAGLACRDWFAAAAGERGMAVSTDGNGNQWARWNPASRPNPAAAGDRAVVTGSHLDSVPDGGAFDGALGVASAFAAIDVLRERGFTPARPIVVAAFTEEEGARFGVACLGSRLLTGAISPAAARGLRDAAGVTLADAMADAGCDPGRLGPDDELLGGIDTFVELHIEQGRQLADIGGALAVGAGIWPHGRWRFDFAGRADHAGTTVLADRHDPMLPAAATVIAARQVARRRQMLCTFGKISAAPGAVNAICAEVRAWLDARAADEGELAEAVADITAAADRAGAEHGVAVTATRESFTPLIDFDPALRARLSGALALHAGGARAGNALAGNALAGNAAAGGRAKPVPELRTGAGHDAGVLAGRVKAAMLFVRNPTGVSHAPAEHADPADCDNGVAALAVALAELASR
jgi:N-carbamoyl-L-amino-acid hydrolase